VQAEVKTFSSFLIPNVEAGIGTKVENRIDQRMPPEPDHRFLSPFQDKRPATNRFKKTVFVAQT
jgi:hypothetical protein